MENLPMPTAKGWRWERVYRSQTLIVETYREMGQTIAELWIKGDCNHYFMHSDYETSPCDYCEQGMGYLEFLVEEKLEFLVEEKLEFLVEEKLGVDEDEKVTA